MDWKNEGWVRLYRRNTPEWLAVPWQSRSFFDELLKLAEYAGPDRGLVRLGPKGLRAIAGAVHWPLDVVEKAVADLAEDGCVEPVERGLMIKNYIPAQDAIKSASLKNKDYRAKLAFMRPEISEPRQEVAKPRPSETERDRLRLNETERAQEEEEEEEQTDKSLSASPPEHMPTEGGERSDPKRAEIGRVFETWRSLHSNQRSKLDPKRAARIRSRLGEGWTVAELEAALRGALHDDWLMGRDPKSSGRAYRGLETLLRDSAQVERLNALYESAKSLGGAVQVGGRPGQRVDPVTGYVHQTDRQGRPVQGYDPKAPWLKGILTPADEPAPTSGEETPEASRAAG